MKSKKAILDWMKRNKSSYIDYTTNEVNYTWLVEAWDLEESTGSSTLDPNHIAWEIALTI